MPKRPGRGFQAQYAITLERMTETPSSAGEITELLRSVRDGSGAGDAESRVVQLTYDEMRRIAGSLMHGQQAGTINATALVHEAWLKLSRKLDRVSDRCHFLALAA